jgi:hypothetical protein
MYQRLSRSDVARLSETAKRYRSLADNVGDGRIAMRLRRIAKKYEDELRSAGYALGDCSPGQVAILS